MRRSEQPFRLPNKPLTDDSLTYTARCLCAAIYSHRDSQGLCQGVSIAQLAALAGCTVPTTVKNIRDLEELGYLSHRNARRFDEALGHMVYSENIYNCLVDVTSDYTLVPKGVFSHGIKAGTLVVLLYLYILAGNEYRAFPSLVNIASGLHMGRSTVCRALDRLARESLIYKEHCLNDNGSFNHNSYFLLQRAAEYTGQPIQREDCNALSVPDSTPQTGLCGPLIPFPCICFMPPTTRWRPPFGWG